MDKKSVFIAVPNTGNMRVELTSFLMSTIHKCEFLSKTFLFFPQKRPIDANRNHIVEKFLESGFDYLLMIDSDIAPASNVIEMIKNDVKICSADIHAYRPEGRIRLALKKEKRGYSCAQINEDEVNEVDACGTGCLLVHRDVFEKIKTPYFKFQYDEKGALIKGEDFYFCDKARDEGFKINYDARYKTAHYTTISI